MSTSPPSQPFRFTIDAIGGLGSAASHSQRPDLADDGLLRETRKELRRIVADVSSLCHSRVEPKRFWPKFLNLVGMAIAAEAAIVWQKNDADSAKVSQKNGDQRSWHVVTHCGSLDDRLLSHRSAPGHAAMISEIGDVGGPVAVPPGADWDSEEPGNPTTNLATVVPVPVDPGGPVHWLIELFLPPGGGPATQRGYLRFLAQMTDLAAEYLRAERLRSVTRAADFSHRAALMLASLQQQTGDSSFSNHLVDAIAQFTSAERVSLVALGHNSTKVLAVSGLSQVDRLSPVTKTIIEIAKEADGPEGLILTEPSPEHDSPSDEAIDEGDLDAMASSSSRPMTADGVQEQVVQSGSLHLRGVAILADPMQHRLVIEDNYPRCTSNEELERWRVLAMQIAGLLSVHCQQTTTGFARLVTRRSHKSHSLLRRSFVPLGIAASLLIAGMIPVPFVIPAQGHLQPATMQTLYAPRTAVVAEIYVVHDQHVERGQPIIKLQDDLLSQQMEQLSSRMSILSEQMTTLQEEQTRANGRDASLLEELSLRERSIREDMRSLQSQWKICEKIQASLILYAHCDGKIDAWQLDKNLKDRPIERGQALLSIIPDNQPWFVHAQIPQNRLDHFVALKERQESAKEQVAAKIIVSAFPDIQLSGLLSEMGPVAGPTSASSASTAEASALATFNVDVAGLPLQQSGAPVELGIPCGHRPLAYVVSQDLVRLGVQTFSLYR